MSGQTGMARAQGILAEALGCAPVDIKPQDTTETLERWDSLAHMRLIMRLEEELGSEIAPELIFDLVSVQGILDMLSGTPPPASAPDAMDLD